MSDYTPAEIMVTAAARQIQDHELVFVGMRLPLLAFMLAKETHAPSAIGVFENGVIRDRPAAGPIITMGDCPNQTHALKLCGLDEVMSILSRGRVGLGFIGGAQVDRFGNVNTHRVELPGGKAVRLPGSGGGADIACLAGRLLIIMNHERRRLVRALLVDGLVVDVLRNQWFVGLETRNVLTAARDRQADAARFGA